MRDSKKSIALRQISAVMLLQLEYSLDPLTPDLANEVLKIAPMTSPVWSQARPSIMTVSSFEIGEVRKERLRSFIDKNPDRLTRAFVLAQLAGEAFTKNDTLELRELRQELNSRYGDLTYAKAIIQELNGEKRILAGKRAPEFFARTLGIGDTVSSEKFKGKYVLLHFWASYETSSQAEMPYLTSVYEKYKDKKLEIVSFSLDRSPVDVNTFRSKEWKMPWKNVYLHNDFRNSIAKRFEVVEIPKLILINPKGNIIATDIDLRGEALGKTLSEFLK
jgi:thiol-disulfide isomerase/thioredoxin